MLGLAISYFLAMLSVFYFLFRNRGISLTPEGKWIACGMLLLFIAMPFQAAGSAYDDTRIAIATISIVPAFLSLGLHVAS
jgi:hypothetical protein